MLDLRAVPDPRPQTAVLPDDRPSDFASLLESAVVSETAPQASPASTSDAGSAEGLACAAIPTENEQAGGQRTDDAEPRGGPGAEALALATALHGTAPPVLPLPGEHRPTGPPGESPPAPATEGSVSVDAASMETGGPRREEASAAKGGAGWTGTLVSVSVSRTTLEDATDPMLSGDGGAAGAEERIASEPAPAAPAEARPLAQDRAAEAVPVPFTRPPRSPAGISADTGLGALSKTGWTHPTIPVPAETARGSSSPPTSEERPALGDPTAAAALPTVTPLDAQPEGPGDGTPRGDAAPARLPGRSVVAVTPDGQPDSARLSPSPADAPAEPLREAQDGSPDALGTATLRHASTAPSSPPPSTSAAVLRDLVLRAAIMQATSVGERWAVEPVSTAVAASAPGERPRDGDAAPVGTPTAPNPAPASSVPAGGPAAAAPSAEPTAQKGVLPIDAQRPAAPSEPAVTSERVAVVRQVLDRIEALNLSRGPQEISVQLRPEHLGELRVRVVAEADRVATHIVADNAAARDAIASDREVLRAALEQRGFALTDLDVTLRQGYDDTRQTDHPPAAAVLPRQGSGADAATSATQAPVTSTQDLAVRADGKVDYRA